MCEILVHIGPFEFKVARCEVLVYFRVPLVLSILLTDKHIHLYSLHLIDTRFLVHRSSTNKIQHSGKRTAE